HSWSVLNAGSTDGVRLPAGLRPAVSADLDAVLTLLHAAGLPTVGVTESFAGFIVATRNDTVVGAGGLEIAGNDALLRSLVVRDDERGSGTGQALTARLLRAAREAGLGEVWLLTETAPHFFERFGFRASDRTRASEA